MSSGNSPDLAKIEQMFLGEYERTLDDKGRLILPATFRDALGSRGAVVTRGLDRCVVLFPSDHFLHWREKIENLPLTSGQGRILKRHFYSGAAVANADGQGRVSIPSFLREYAGLTGAVIVSGCNTYVEIWDVQQWNEQCTRFEESGDDAAAWDALGI
jgi:MraZ protein